MNKKKISSGIVRINPTLQEEISNLLQINDNKFYCNSTSAFANIALRELLDSIKKKKNKIRIDKK